MLREFLDLIIMQFKVIKAYLPLMIFYAIFFPLAFMLAFGFISMRSYYPYILSGTITFYMSIGIFVTVSQSLGYERRSGRFSLMVSAGIPKELYALSIALGNGISTLIMIPIVIIIGYFLLHVIVKSILFLLISIITSIFTSSMLGITVGLGIKNFYAVNQYSQIIGFVLTFFAPVYYPITYIPIPFRYLTLLEPTTYMSQAIYNAFIGSSFSLLWSLGVIVYGIVLMIINSRVLKSI
ncbi:ABC transporter permease [Sulfurisphaera javensis]|uniref:ABC transporter permease n=1 Tax=Sulfurisphaera javensis TaxID=2049879 RepID=A0AAT9GQ10_9CREN